MAFIITKINLIAIKIHIKIQLDLNKIIDIRGENKMILYTSDCPACKVLEAKLNQKNVSFTTEKSDFSKLEENKIMTFPVLEVDGKLLTFNDARRYVDNL